MEPFDRWPSEDTVDPRELARAEARAAHALGRLDGQLQGLSALEERLLSDAKIECNGVQFFRFRAPQ